MWAATGSHRQEHSSGVMKYFRNLYCFLLYAWLSVKSQYWELKQQEDLDLVNGLGKGGAVGSIAAWQIQGLWFNQVIKLRFPPTSQNHAGGSLMFGDVHVCVNVANSPHFYAVDQIYSLFTLHFILSLFLFLALEEAGENTIHQPLSRNDMIHACSSFHFECRLSYTGLQGTWNLYSRGLEVQGRGHPANSCTQNGGRKLKPLTQKCKAKLLTTKKHTISAKKKKTLNLLV